MKRLAFLLLALLPCTALAANSLPGMGEGSCGPRETFSADMAQAGAKPLNFSMRPVYVPRRDSAGEIEWFHAYDEEIAVWADQSGHVWVVGSNLHTDPQMGEIAWSCVRFLGSGAKPFPVLVPKRGA